MSLLRPILLLLLALAIGGAGVYGFRLYIASLSAQPQTVIPPKDALSMVVAAQDIPYGQALTHDHLKVIPWHADQLPINAFSAIDQILGPKVPESSASNTPLRYAKQTIAAGQAITTLSITEGFSRLSLSGLLKPGQSAVSVYVDAVSGVAGFILPGDRIDLFVTHDQEDVLTTDRIESAVRVVGVDQNTNTQQGTALSAKTLTLALTAEQAQRVTLARQLGRVTASLLSSTTETTQSAKRLAANDLLPKRSIEVAKVGKTIQVAPPRQPKPQNHVTVVRALQASKYDLSK